MKKILALALVLVMALSLGLSGCQQEETKNKIGFIYIGPANDGGYSEAHDNGRTYLEEELKKLNLNYETIVRENVPEGSECEEVMKQMIDQGCSIIFATSFGYMEYVANVAKQYPDVKFFHCSGYMTADNMSNYFGRIYQTRYLSGIVAGLKTKTNKLGYVAAFPIPEVIRGVNSFTLGVRAVNPDATVDVVWTNTWIDPAKATEGAKALLDKGCDVITQHQDSPGPQQAAQDKGVWSIGYNVDSSDVAPKSYMTAPIWNWGIYYADQVKKIHDGTWKSGSYWGGLEDGIVGLAPLTDIAPEEAQAKVDEMKQAIIDGSFHVFEGPLKDQDGNVKITDGQVMTDEEMLSMDWFVEGVVGNIPE